MKIDKIIALIDQQMGDLRFSVSERLRTAALYADEELEGGITTSEWVEACSYRDINAGTARNRLNEMRRIWSAENAN